MSTTTAFRMAAAADDQEESPEVSNDCGNDRRSFVGKVSYASWVTFYEVFVY